ncbi:glycoside hydrolase family 3 C-terminal domain-containing protein [Dermatobacter hominis]|uniref:glycoside hydrolase family 3 C-terminal domain-containing protein n=1 Tax=Dermatobacter hominis TaxID=2884263 RepID=UPI001D1242D1|nr:glycoside hydrolase family 3 C-terminal domain-containing protein [Dermatobacter hominis]UDY36978.1 glycoside hydrolase family 3 C-terminal domain-containing protein [Dermatobacter hominis]
MSTDATAAPSPSAEAVVAALDLPTKVRLLSGRGFWALEPVPAGPGGSGGIDGIVVADGPHGLRCQVTAADHLGLAPAQPATCFPTAAALGSTWDVELLEEVGAAIGDEARALGVSVVLGPGLNLKRHPAGGRSFEYLSEDPLLGGRLAAAMVRGIQARGVGASVKHYAVNNQESHRLVVDAVVDERTLRELYLRGFEIVVTESDPWTVMCSYNRVNGTYASDHTELLTTILRDEWGFGGLVMSDWGATNDRVAGVRAGLDLEMPGSEGAFDGEVLAAVADGSLLEADVDRCATRVVELLQRGRLDGARPDPQHEQHHALARRAAAEGSVLLVNDGVLPLAAEGTIAVIGGFATHPRHQGAGSSQVNPTRLDRALDTIRERVGGAGTVTFAEGYDARTGRSTPRQFAEALATARAADVAVVFAGLPAAWESEGFDRTTLDLPDDHVRLIEALAATSTPVVVVLSNGGVVHLPWAERVEAVLECWLGGQAGAGGATDVLFGDAEPGGRLAESIPVHVAQLPADRNFPGQPRQVEYREGPHVGYRFHDTAGVPARFAFGAGLSYTTFEWTDVEVTGDGTDRTARVTVTNTGDRAGSDVVQVYVRDPESAVHRPHQELQGFAKVHLGPGERATVEVPLDRRSFAVWDVAAHDWLVEAGRFEVVVARSSVDPVQVVPIEVASDDVVTPVPAPVDLVATDEEFAALLGRPVPTPKAVRPFDRNSTLEDLESTVVGRLLSSVVVREGAKRAAQEFPDPDDATIEMVRSSLKEGPVRMLVLMGGGILDFAQADVLLKALDGRWTSAARSVLAGLAARLRRP